jgi:Big-like domain-containing protein
MTCHRQFCRRAVLLPATAGLFLFIASCGDFFVSESSTQSISVTPAAVLLMAASASDTTGDTFQLKATATAVNGNTSDVTSTATWSSNNSKITVTAGLVTVNGDTTGGDTATITAKQSGASGSAGVFVFTGTTPTTLNLTGNTGTLAPGNYQLTVKLPDGTDVTRFVAWTSSNTTVATVTSTGLVTVLATATSGATATVTATANFGAPSGTTPPTPVTVTATFTRA